MRELLEALAGATRGMSHISAVVTERLGTKGALWVSLSGYLDAEAATALMKPLITVMETWEGEARSIVVDMEHLEYIASLGIGLLAMAAATARKRNISLVLHAPQPSVLRVLELLGIPTFIPVSGKEP
jgi:anti-anti-sigma factor